MRDSVPFRGVWVCVCVCGGGGGGGGGGGNIFISEKKPPFLICRSQTVMTTAATLVMSEPYLESELCAS